MRNLGNFLESVKYEHYLLLILNTKQLSIKTGT